MKEYLAEILDSLRKNRLRTFLTGFAIVWGILMFTVLLGLSNGLRNGILQSFGSQLINSGSIEGGYTSENYGGFSRYRQVMMDERDLRMLETEFGDYIENLTVYSFGIHRDTLFNGQHSAIVLVNATMPEYLRISGKKTVAGRGLNRIDEEEGRKHIILDYAVARNLFPDTDPVGSHLELGGVSFQVVGVLEKPKERWSGNPKVYIPLSTAGRLFNQNRPPISTVYYTFRDGIGTEEITAFEQAAKKRLLELHGYSPDERWAFWIQNIFSMRKELDKVISILNLFIWIIGCGTLAAGVIGVSNIMIVIVKERTTEIGIRKSIGATPGSVVRMILFEALTITTLFGYLGMFLGVAVMEAAGDFITRKSAETMKITGMESLIQDPTLELSIILSATIILIVSGLLAGYLPARRAARIKTIDALRGIK